MNKIDRSVLIGQNNSAPVPVLPQSMKKVDPNVLVEQLNWRYATKQFDPQRKISEEEWGALEEALVLTPSSFGLQPWKFIVVKDASIRERLVGASWGQRQVADASHLVVFAIKKNLREQDIDDHLDRVSDVRGVPRETLGQYREMMVGSLIKRLDESRRNDWAANQVYIALGNFLTSAALLGIDACPMEGIEPAKYDEILGLSTRGLTTVVAAAAGYRAVTDKYSRAKKVRFSRDQVVMKI
ncbi:MAG TPA: NAD(P)H-dependent oxidoreductase [Verrucomicrobiae bacterium]|nr:NAD(P)H-dependent oxidoreductase [Verrucomicrobiae bacterium]